MDAQAFRASATDEFTGIGISTMAFSIDDIERARRGLAGIAKATPLMRSATLDRMLAAEVYLKPENLQKTGSFKIRGAYNRIAALSPAEGDARSRRCVGGESWAGAGLRGHSRGPQGDDRDANDGHDRKG